MTIEVRLLEKKDEDAWNDYVSIQTKATVYHQLAWGKVVEKSYGHKVYNLIALRFPENEKRAEIISEKEGTPRLGTTKSVLVGVLPLVHIKHFLFGNGLFSLPFADLGGIVADDKEGEEALLVKATEIAEKLNNSRIELRQEHRLEEPMFSASTGSPLNIKPVPHKRKVRMLLDLPASSKLLMELFKAKLRSQIRRPQKDGLFVQHGGIELLDNFYTVFAENMRDLGSPVHSKKFFENILNEFPNCSRIFIIYKDDCPLACSLTLGFRTVLSNPWASSLRRYSRLSPNMLLYWSMLEYACDNGYTTFDFGRSTFDEGTYKFKKQWGAEERLLCWYTLSGRPENIQLESTDKSRFELAMRVWKRLPVSVSIILGPSIRKNIGL